MNQLKKLLGLSLIPSLGVCLVFCIVFANKPLNAQTPSNTNSLSSNSNSDSTEKWLEINAPLVGGITSTVASIISIIGSSKIKEERIKQLQEDCKRKEEEYERKVKEKEVELQSKYNRGEDQKKINTDFYALVVDELGYKNMTGLLEVCTEDENGEELEYRLKQCKETFDSSGKAIDDLLSKDKDGKKILYAIVYESINSFWEGDKNEQFQNKCNHLYSYLRGWLICSIRYQTSNLQVKWIKNKALSREEIKQALKKTDYFILNEDKVKEYIREESSRKLISKYINILLKKI